MIVTAPHRVWYTVPHGPCNPTHWSACKLYVNIIFGTSVISPFTGVTPSSIQHWNIGREKTLACARNWPLPQRGVIGNPIKRKCHAGNCVSQCESSARGGSQWTQGRGDMWRRSLTASIAPCPSRAPSAAARLRFHSLPLWSHRLHLTLPIAESQSSITVGDVFLVQAPSMYWRHQKKLFLVVALPVNYEKKKKPETESESKVWQVLKCKTFVKDPRSGGRGRKDVIWFLN